MDSKDAGRQGEESTGNNPDRSVGENKKPVGENSDRFSDIKNKLARNKIGLVVLAMCIAALITYGIIHKEPETKNIQMPKEEVSAVIDERTLVYPFVIPFENTGEYTYIVVEVTFDVPDRKLHGELTEKQDRIRTIIYGILLDEVQKTKDVPSPAEIKKHINRDINAVLENGNINEVFVTRFIAV